MNLFANMLAIAGLPEKFGWAHIGIIAGAVVVLALLIWGIVKFSKRQIRRSHMYTYEKQREDEKPRTYTYEKQKEDEKPRTYTYQKQREEEKKREEKRIKARNGK